MALTGFVQRTKGKVKLHELVLGPGGIVDGVSGIAGGPQCAIRLPLAVTATANTDFVVPMPVGATILGMWCFTTTAFTAGTDAKLQVGAAAAGAGYVAAVSIAAIGTQQLTMISTVGVDFAAMPQNLFLRIVQTGTATAVGAATFVVEYAL
jgi:hypothetical protein